MVLAISRFLIQTEASWFLCSLFESHLLDYHCSLIEKRGEKDKKGGSHDFFILKGDWYSLRVAIPFKFGYDERDYKWNQKGEVHEEK